jgi:hypothetical protein
LGDGSGKQIFKAASWEELTEKLADAHANATRKIQELSRERKKYEPEKKSSDWQELQGQHLKQEELAALQSDPRQAMRRIFQAETGLTFDEFRDRENQRRKMEAESWAQADFVQRHAAEYSPTQQNAEKIFRFLTNENLPISKRNLDYAFEQLRGELAGKAAPAAPEAPRGESLAQRAEPAASPSQPQRVSPMPSSMRPSLGARPLEDSGAGIDAAEVARIAQMPPTEMKARIEQLYRRERTGR